MAYGRARRTSAVADAATLDLRGRAVGPTIVRFRTERAGQAASDEGRGSPLSQPSSVTVSCRNVWKVYGPKADRIVGSPDAELPRAELLEKTGCVAAVRDVSFEVTQGEVFVVMGLSGSGKSTLVRMINRLHDPTAGQVFIDGEDVVAVDQERLRDIRRRKVSMVFQHFGLFPHRTIADNVAYGLEVRGMDKPDRLAKAKDVLDVVGLGAWGTAFPDELSGGMQQRVGLARALATDPEIMLFDEPFSALDPLIRRDMQDEVVRLQREVRKTMIFITHDLAEALKLGDRIAIMKDGGFVQVGTPEDVVAHPADDYVADFTRDVPRAHVLTARAIMRPLDGEVPGGAATIAADTVVQELIPLMARDDELCCVVEGEQVIGVVDRQAVLSAMVESVG
jgi:glycine betaine/proline transport system ATP-binding protein